MIEGSSLMEIGWVHTQDLKMTEGKAMQWRVCDYPPLWGHPRFPVGTGSLYYTAI
jgi:hypothetical protein